ncbi:deoxyribose-phosphate aldolase [bacterium]|nr:deoxyribose-phosphate aldolase [bacterium]
MTIPPHDLGSYIDHTLLKPDATTEAIDAICEEAIEHEFASVCVNPSYVARAVENLANSEIPVAAVIGFPLGATSPEIKAAETREVIANGAMEIDMVINIGALKNGDYQHVYRDIYTVVKAASNRIVKVILETAFLSEDQKIAACVLAKTAGAAFVKTSTGFGPSGATEDDVRLMRRIVGPKMGVKASGGIRTAEIAQRMITAGADRLGASASVSIVKG